MFITNPSLFLCLLDPSFACANRGSTCESDGDLCTIEECQDGVCIGIEETNCSHMNEQCKVGICNSDTGQCETQNASE